jgi:hypothetical protein
MSPPPFTGHELFFISFLSTTRNRRTRLQKVEQVFAIIGAVW